MFCTIRYTALWSDEMTRGRPQKRGHGRAVPRFSIFRDGQPLDPEHFGLQSVRSMQKGLKSVAARDQDRIAKKRSAIRGDDHHG